MNFKSKIVLITGGSSGIGASTAELFAKEGANIAIVGRNGQRLQKVADKCQQFGAKTLSIIADMTVENDVKRIVEKTIEHFEKLDILVNNAGMYTRGSILDGKVIEDFDRVINTNLRSVVLLTTLATPYLMKTCGNIINISSMLGSSFVGYYNHMAYSMSKAALNIFTRAAALELSEVGVRVNSISPGPTRTGILESSCIDTTWEEIEKAYKISRVVEPEEVSGLILFVASDKAKCITGIDYIIDNGCILKH